MTVLTEGVRPGEALVSEANHSRSRESVVVADNQNLKANQIIALSGGEVVAYDGSNTAVGMLFDAVDTTDAAVTSAPGVAFMRDCELNVEEVIWDAAVTAPQQLSAIASLGNVGIILREASPS